MSNILKEGDKAPDFCMKNEHGEDVRLSDFSGKKLILYFYPKDMTEGCTKESCNLRDHYPQLKNEGFEVLGVSMDNEKRHQKFIDKYDLPFSLLADVDKEVIEAYGCWQLKKFMGREYMGIVRTTFVINEEGVIDRIFNKVITKAHAEQIMESYSIA